MPIGLSNSPATFQYLTNSVFSDFLGDFLAVYLNNLLVNSASELEHLEYL